MAGQAVPAAHTPVSRHQIGLKLMAMNITKLDGACSIRLDGDLTIFQIADFHSQLLAECQDAQNVTFDLSDVNEVDTAGVQLLISLQKQLNSVDGNLLLAGQSEQLLNTLNAFNLSGYFESTEGIS